MEPTFILDGPQNHITALLKEKMDTNRRDVGGRLQRLEILREELIRDEKEVSDTKLTISGHLAAIEKLSQQNDELEAAAAREQQRFIAAGQDGQLAG